MACFTWLKKVLSFKEIKQNNTRHFFSCYPQHISRKIINVLKTGENYLYHKTDLIITSRHTCIVDKQTTAYLLWVL